MSKISDRMENIDNACFLYERQRMVKVVAPELEHLDVLMKANSRLIDEQYALLRSMAVKIERMEKEVIRQEIRIDALEKRKPASIPYSGPYRSGG